MTPEGELDELYDRLRDLVGLPTGPATAARDAVNQPMIRHWCDAMGDTNPNYTDEAVAAEGPHGGIVAPPTMLQAWNMRGLRRADTHAADGPGPMDQMTALLDGAGYTSVVATDCEQEYLRYLRPGDLLHEEGLIEDVSPLKRTALGEGYFVTTLRSYRDQHGELVGTMRFRILKFRPPTAAPAPAPAHPAAGRPRPAVNLDTAFFWEGTNRGELRIQRCASCGTLRHPPSPACGQCGSLDVDHVVSSGRGTVYSFVVHHHPPMPPFVTPFVVALVELEEGTRVVGNLLVDDPADAAVGLPVEVEFQRLDDEIVLPQWVPQRQVRP